MRVLIIGGTGLISSAITRQLIERGVQVVHYNRGKSERRVEGDVQQLRGDRTDFTTFEQQMQGQENFDCVIDMICYRPQEAESAVRAFNGRTSHFIFCSTVDTYTKPAPLYPIREDMEREGIKAWDYSADKVLCERIFSTAHQQGAFPVTIIRPAHTYGLGSSILHSLGGRTTYIDRIRKGLPIIVHGDGSSLWVSCFNEDVARAFVNAIGQPQTFGKAYHVTGEEWQTWNRYHEQVAIALGAPAPTLVHIPTALLARLIPDRARICAVNFQFNNIFDNTAAHTDLGFRYTVPWLEGVQRMVAWLEEHGRIESYEADPVYDRVLALWERLSQQALEELDEKG